MTDPPCRPHALPTHPRGVATFDFEGLYLRERRYLFGLVRGMGVAHQDREDCVHDVVVRAIQLRDRYDPARPLRPWLAAVARRVVLERRRARREVCLDALPEHLAHSDPEHDVDVSRAWRRLRRATSALCSERREVWIAHELREVPAPELARALALPINTVYSRLRLARQDVRAALDRAAAEVSFAARQRALMAS